MDDTSTQPILPAVDPAISQGQAAVPPPPTPTVDDSLSPQAPALNYGFTNDLPAEDVELIEKAWVEKAKSIVNSTHGDPYTQNKQLSKIKAEYIKKRYNKDVRVSE